MHIRQALDVIVCPAPSAADSIIAAATRPENQLTELVGCEYYTVHELPIKGTMTMNHDFPFLIVCVIDGEGFIDDRPLEKGDHFILPHGYGEMTWRGEMRLILARV
jgi:beta-glucosidase